MVRDDEVGARALVESCIPLLSDSGLTSLDTQSHDIRLGPTSRILIVRTQYPEHISSLHQPSLPRPKQALLVVDLE
jgi:hypothetical protein